MLDLLTLADTLESGRYEQSTGLLIAGNKRCVIGVALEAVYDHHWAEHISESSFKDFGWKCLPYAEMSDAVTLELQMEHPETIALIRGKGTRIDITWLNDEEYSFAWLAAAIRRGVITVEYETGVPFPWIDMTFDDVDLVELDRLSVDRPSDHACVVAPGVRAVEPDLRRWSAHV